MNNETLNSSALMDQRAAAAYLGTTVGTLNTWRHYGKQKIIDYNTSKKKGIPIINRYLATLKAESKQ